jgi:serine/threonine protein kinase
VIDMHAELALRTDSTTHHHPLSLTIPHALPDGTLIEGFRIEHQIGEGGFGIVYLAWDTALQRHVAIKEYMPSSLAVRSDASMAVTMRSEKHRETFEAGLKSFVNEARLLARFDHPALVKVLRYWEANQTAYMAMPYYEGPTLKAALESMDRPAAEPQLRDWLDSILDALSAMHCESCYHRDISPDNILLTPAGPLLLDFGAARHVISDRTQALTTMLKPGFAPIEQYGGTMLQGPWTDLYALAGVVHYAITGQPPIAAVSRIVDDTRLPLVATHAGQYSESFLHAMDVALAVRPEHRPQDVVQFRELLEADAAPAVAQTEPENLMTDAKAPRRRRYGAVLAAVVIVGGLGLWWAVHSRAPQAAAVAPASMPAPTAAPSPPAPVSAPAETPSTSSAAVRAPVPPAASGAAPPEPSSRAAQASAAKTQRPKAASPRDVPVGPKRVPAEAAVAAPVDPAKPSRCSDLFLKSSLDSLTPSETAYLKKECR